MNKCTECGSYAINHHCHGRDGSDPELCDVCYWRKRATDYTALEAENARLVERTGYLVEFVQQMARQQGEPYYQKLAKAALKKWSGL